MPRFDSATRCTRCHAPLSLCYCALLPRIDCRTHITLIVHRSELFRSTATATTTHLCLSNSRILPYGQRDQVFTPADLFTPRGRALYLFPQPDAEILDSAWVENNPGPWHLIVPDGSWGQAVRIRRRIQALRTVQAVRLANPGPSHYELRRARGPERLCTLEAVAHALAVLEGPALRDTLLAALTLQVERMKGSRPRFSQNNPAHQGLLP